MEKSLLRRSMCEFKLATRCKSSCNAIDQGWKQLFEQWRLCSSTNQVVDLADPVSNQNYIPRGCSPEEHMVRQMGVANYFEPEECLVENIPAGDMRDVISYIVDDRRRAEVVPHSFLACSSHNLSSRWLCHTHKGCCIPAGSLPACLILKME